MLVGHDAQYFVIANNRPQVSNLQHPIDQGQSLIFALSPLQSLIQYASWLLMRLILPLFLMDRV